MLAFDAAMAIFNNVPPRITFSELDLPLPCDQIVWETGSYSELVNMQVFPRPRIKLLDAFQLLFVPTGDFVVAMEKETWSCWDCMYLIHLLYSHVWRQTFSNPLLRKSPFRTPAPANILEPLKTAIRNWKTLWDDVRSKLTSIQMAGMGFETSSDSYWTLTKLVVQAFDAGNLKDGAIIGSPTGSSSVISGGTHDGTATPHASAHQPPRTQALYPDPAPLHGNVGANVHMNGTYPDYNQYNMAAAQGMVPMNGIANMNGMPNIQMHPAMNMNAMGMNSMPVNPQMSGVPVAVAPVKQEEGDVTHSANLPPGLGLASGNYTASSDPASATATDFGNSGIDFLPLEADCDTQGAHLRKILRRVK